MKKIFIKLIKCYQSIPGNFHYRCRHIPTCSEYAIIAIDRFGCFKGSFMALKRIIKCNPFTPSGIDLVKEKKNEKN